MPTVLWFRRDLRMADHPALASAAAEGEVVPLFVVDPALVRRSGANRLAYLAASLRALDADLGGSLVVRTGDPAWVVPAVAQEAGAERVHASADFGPYGAARDERVEARVPLARTGSSYAVSPGRVRTGQGTPYQVFTPYLKAWLDHGWRAPSDPTDVTWHRLDGEDLPDWTTRIGLPEAGERAATARWAEFLDGGLDGYEEARDRADLPGTSHLSVALRWGEIHPRTLLADLGASGHPAAAKFRAELAWREFHADVLHHHPQAARWPLRREFERMEHDEPDSGFDAWREGRTGYPLVDAGMRQLRETGWMHNRVRMVTASFLVKDLHVHWRHGARHFMEHLLDGDLASNQLNWQWVAGCGSDAAPYFRVFNPTRQAQRFDPTGAYVRRWVGDLDDGYPEPIVDHAVERREALDRLGRMKG